MNQSITQNSQNEKKISKSVKRKKKAGTVSADIRRAFRRHIIRIINLYHEKEDFMWQLFGIDTTPQETIDYWNE